MTKTKRQLRAEVIEQLKSKDHASVDSDDIVAEIVGAMGYSYSKTTNEDDANIIIDLLTDDDSHEERNSYEERLYDVPVSDCPYCGCERVVIHEYSEMYERPHSYRVEHVDEREAFNAGCFESYFAFDSAEKAVDHADVRAERDELKDLQKQVMSERNHAIAERDELRTECEGLEHANKRQARKIHDVCEANSKLKAELDAYRGKYDGMEFVVPLDKAMEFATDPPGYVKKALADMRAERDEWKAKAERLDVNGTANGTCPDAMGHASDTREKLEADALRFANGFIRGHGGAISWNDELYCGTLKLLDRQAAITERKHRELSIAFQIESDRRITELTAERDMWREKCGKMLDAAHEITRTGRSTE